MARYYYGLSVNDEYCVRIAVESDGRPICINNNVNEDDDYDSEGTHCLIVNGAKMFFEEDIWELEQIEVEMYKLDEQFNSQFNDEYGHIDKALNGERYV